MSGFFGVASKSDCVLELFYGVDYHSHLGTRRGGMAVYGEHGFDRAIHNIENTPFRTKFDGDVGSMKGNMGIGCISDYEPQPLLFSSRIGSFALTFVGKINNYDELLQRMYDTTKVHFQEMTNGTVNVTELIAALICEKDNFVEGIQYVQGLIDGSMTLLLMTKDGIYAARDKMGRTPVEIGQKEGSYCLSFESHAYINLGYEDYKELGPGEIVFVTADGVKTLVEPGKKMKICSFLWVYYGYPTASYEGVNVEEMRYRCGSMLAKRDGDSVHPDIVAGVPDSGIAHAIGYANESGIPYARPFIKYTPTWPRSFMPTNQNQRNLIAKMKLIPVRALIKDKKLLLIDDSIVRGTTSKRIVQLLKEAGAAEVHMRISSPPLKYPCFYGIDISTTKELIAAKKSVEEIRGYIGADSLAFLSLDGLVESIGLGADAPYGGLCVAYFNGDYPTALDDYEADFLKSLTPEDRVRLPEFALYKSKYEGNEYTTTSPQEEY